MVPHSPGCARYVHSDVDRRTYPQGAYTLTLDGTLEFPALECDSVHLKVQSETVC